MLKLLLQPEKHLLNLQSRLTTSLLSDESLADPTPTPSLSPEAVAMALFCWYPYHAKSASTTSYIPEPRSAPDPTAIVQCRICERRVGLWSFADGIAGRREFDLENEHLAWCPIRRQGSEAGWWATEGLLTGQRQGTKRIGKGEGLGWMVSENLEKRKWRV